MKELTRQLVGWNMIFAGLYGLASTVILLYTEQGSNPFIIGGIGLLFHVILSFIVVCVWPDEEKPKEVQKNEIQPVIETDVDMRTVIDVGSVGAGGESAQSVE